MTKEMEFFLSELSQIMEKYGVEMDIIEETINWDTRVVGLEFNIDSIYDHEKDCYERDYCCHLIKGVNFDSKDIK